MKIVCGNPRESAFQKIGFRIFLCTVKTEYFR